SIRHLSATVAGAERFLSGERTAFGRNLRQRWYHSGVCANPPPVTTENLVKMTARRGSAPASMVTRTPAIVAGIGVGRLFPECQSSAAAPTIACRNMLVSPAGRPAGVMRMGETRTGGRLLVECLLAQEVRAIFGVPAESYLPVLDALHDEEEAIRLVPNRHEGGAALAAAAWGQLTGEPGIAFVSCGPGAANAAVGVHSAQQDSAPMILFVGQVQTAFRGREAFQEIDIRAMYGGITKWAVEVDTPERIPGLVARAFATAMSGRPGPVVVALPEDVLAAATEVGPGPKARVPRPAPAKRDIEELARLLQEAERPLVIAGGSGWSDIARADLRAFAEGNSLPVLTAFRRQDLLDSDSPSYVGDAGLGKAEAVRELMDSADLVLALGLRFSENVTDGYSRFAV